MIVGFTGTQDGMNDFQKRQITAFLKEIMPTSVRHGCCVGADEEFNEIAGSLGIKRIGHPSDIKKMTMASEVEELLEPKRPLVRNRDIVDGVELLLAAPKTRHEILRSGTWATIRYAQKIARYLIVCPDSYLIVSP
jgi:hypothetical protein